MAEIKETVKAYILREFLQGEDPDALTDTTQLLRSGVLDSLATLKLVSFLEEEYNVEIEAHETDDEHLGTIEAIRELIASKQ